MNIVYLLQNQQHVKIPNQSYLDSLIFDSSALSLYSEKIDQPFSGEIPDNNFLDRFPDLAKFNPDAADNPLNHGKSRQIFLNWS